MSGDITGLGGDGAAQDHAQVRHGGGDDVVAGPGPQPRPRLLRRGGRGEDADSGGQSHRPRRGARGWVPRGSGT